MTIERMKSIISNIADQYGISRVDLFGSRAAGTNRDDSDIDLIVEFREPVSILSLAMLRDALMEAWGLDVDIVHGPIRDTDILEVGKTVELYAA